MFKHEHAMKSDDREKNIFNPFLEFCVCGASRRGLEMADYGVAYTVWKAASESVELTRSEWHELHTIMHWSIDDENSIIETEAKAERGELTWGEAFNSTKLDFTAPVGMSDGLHWVWHQAGQDWGPAYGVLVKDGKYIPLATAEACLEAVARSYGITKESIEKGEEGIDHVFIEGFTWESETGRLVLHTGS